MRLRITVPSADDHLRVGWAAHLFLNDVDVSQWVSRVVLTVDAGGPLSAEVSFFLTDVDVDVPAVVTGLLQNIDASATLGTGAVRVKGPHVSVL